MTAPESTPPRVEGADDVLRAAVEEPIDVGWYAYSGGAQTMVFHLRETGQWSVHLNNGSASDCPWGYIEQALGVWDLVLITPPALAAVPRPATQPKGPEPGVCDMGCQPDWHNDECAIYWKKAT